MTTKIKVTDFDFDTIKLDFKTFLSTRPEFTDYNFEGSNLNVLLDILAYNTNYHALMANFLANEMFLDTASKRSSVVSHSKTLGYVPKSRSASKLITNIDISYLSTQAQVSNYLLKKGSPVFRTIIDNSSYIFTTASNYSAPIIQDSLNPNSYTIHYENVILYEGAFTTNNLIYNSLTKFVTIPNLDIDLSTLVVMVHDPRRESYDNYSYAKNLLDIDADNKVYFIQEGFDGKFQIYFGDSTFGTEPIDKSDILITYMVTHGAEANGATNWILQNPDSSIMVSQFDHLPITGVSVGGTDRETISSIKFNSINHFGTQNRAVVSNDYAVLAQQYSDNIKAVIAWGGEDDLPPVYNTVMLCAIPVYGEDLTFQEKEYLTKYLKTKAVGSTNIVFKSPQYLDLKISVEFTYDTKLIRLSVYELEASVRETIGLYAKEYLYNFSGSFKESKFLALLDKVNESITGTTINVNLVKVLPIQKFMQQTHIVDFSNPIDTQSLYPAITSTGFYTTGTTEVCYLADDRKGKLKIVKYNVNGVLEDFKTDVGDINYLNGKMSVSLYITSTKDVSFKIFVNPKVNNIVSSRNNILRIVNENVVVVSKGE